MNNKIKAAKRYTISIGFNDSETRKQEIETERILKLVNNICKEYDMSFSCVIQNGGYIDDSNVFVSESSIALSFVGASKKVVDEVAKDLCVFLHQESVLITIDRIKYYYVRDSIKLS